MVKLVKRNAMKTIRGMIRRMNKNIMTYDSGSILGRSVYKSDKFINYSNDVSIFGKKVYKKQERKIYALCGSLVKKFLKR